MSKVHIAKDVFAFFMVSLLFMLASEETMVIENSTVVKQSCVIPAPQVKVKKEKPFQKNVAYQSAQQPAKCFVVNFPIEIIYPDRRQQTVTNLSALDNLVDTWFEKNPDANSEPTFIYPFTITMKNGRKVAVENETQFLTIADACDQEILEENYNSVNTFCFDFMYPINLVTPKGNLLEVKSDKEVDQAIINWSTLNPESNQELAIHFPVKIRFDDGFVVQLKEVNALSEAIQYCESDSLEYEETEEEVDSTKTLIGA